MAYAIAWNEATPVGASVNASTIDTELQNLKKSIRERMNDVLAGGSGGTDWETDATNPKRLLLGQPRVRVGKSADQAIANSTSTVVSWNQESFDVGGLHDNSTNNSRLTIPADEAGVYMVGVSIPWDASTTGYRQADLKKNGTTAELSIVATNTTGAVFTVQSIVYPLQTLVATDYLEIEVVQNSSGSLDIKATRAAFWLLRIN